MDKANVAKEDLIKVVEEEGESKGIVVATLGKACSDAETLIKMIDAGMNYVRIRLCQNNSSDSNESILDCLHETFKYRPHK